jgi:hypothetical protein
MKAGAIISGFTTYQISLQRAIDMLIDVRDNNDLSKVNVVVKLDVKVKSK